MVDPHQDRSPMAIAMEWASRIMTVAAEMVLPGLAGLWADVKLGISPALTILGFILGMTLAMWHLLRMTGAIAAKSTTHGGSEEAKHDRETPGRPTDHES